MRRIGLRLVVLTALWTLIAGCSANWSSIYRSYEISDYDGTKTVLIDT